MLYFVQANLEALAPQQIGKEQAASALLAGFALDPDKIQGVPGDRVGIDVVQHQAGIHAGYPL